MRLRRQRGVALITVLLVFALVAVIATNILQRSQLNLRSVGGLVETRQAYYYALAGEAYARQILARDIVERRSATDTLLEPWGQTKEQQPFPLDNGTLQVEIHDLQGRFNLNNLAAGDPASVGQFRSLLTALQLNVNYANELLDWLDTDRTLSPNGAEDPGYTGYLAANGAEADVSALRLLHSMQPEDYAKLAPHVTMLPVSGTALNINTAAVEVLSTIMSSSQAAQVVARQQGGGYNNAADLQPPPMGLASLSSNYFEVVVTVNYANRWQRTRTVLQRITNPGPVAFKVLSRVRSPLIDDSE